MFSTLADYIESRRRVAALQLTFTQSLALSAEQRKELETALEGQTNATAEEFTEAFVGWLTEEKGAPENAKSKRAKKTS